VGAAAGIRFRSTRACWQSVRRQAIIEPHHP